MINRYAFTVELPQALPAALDHLRAACERAHAALRRVVDRLAASA